MDKQEITSYLVDTYGVWLKLKDPQFFKEAIKHALIALDAQTVTEILSNFDLRGLDDCLEEAYKTVHDMYKEAYNNQTNKEVCTFTYIGGGLNND